MVECVGRRRESNRNLNLTIRHQQLNVYVLRLSLITVVRYPAVLERSTIEAAKQNGYFLAVVSCYLINKNVVNNQSGRRGRLREEAKSIHSECEEN